MLHMERIGVRELRLNASRYLRRVASGETIEVTDRGRPVARIVPARRPRGLEGLLEEGRATTAEGDLLEFDPLPLRRGVSPPSQVLAGLRRAER